MPQVLVDFPPVVRRLRVWPVGLFSDVVMDNYLPPPDLPKRLETRHVHARNHGDHSRCRLDKGACISLDLASHYNEVFDLRTMSPS